MQSSSQSSSSVMIFVISQDNIVYQKFSISVECSSFIRTGSGMIEFETVEDAVEALVLVNNLRVEGVQGEAEGMEFDIKLCFSRTFM